MTDLQCPARIVLVRHGEAAYESDVTTGAGGTLTPQGRQQAREAGLRLAGERVAHVYASDMARAVQTAELLATGVGAEVTVREGLQEFDPGVHHGEPHDSGWGSATVAAWLEGDLDAHWEGGESARELAARVARVLDELADLHRGETVVVVSHGGAILATLSVLTWRRDRPDDVPHCSGWVLERDGDGWRDAGRL